MADETPNDDAITAEDESTMPKAKKWNVDVLETSRRVVVVESFTRSEAKHRAKNAAFWLEKGEALEVVKSSPKGAPREWVAPESEDTATPPPASPAGKGSK